MQTFYIHPKDPQPRLVSQAANILHQDGILVYPTDTSYAFACMPSSKLAVQRLKLIRQLDDSHQFTLLCRDLSEIANYAEVDNQQFKWLKAHTPAAITFLLNASKSVPKKLAHPKKKTIGIRVPSNAIAQSLLNEMNTPLLTSSMILPGYKLPFDEAYDIEDSLGNQIDGFINVGTLTTKLSTIVDMTQYPPKLIRQGAGDISQIIE